jgi:hypothetical protein
MVRGFPREVVEKLVSCLRAGLAAGGMSDEDEAGVEAMLEDFDAWLDQAETSPDDVQRIVHEEFVRWFDRQIAGPVERYRGVAETIWGLWTAGAGGGDPIPA